MTTTTVVADIPTWDCPSALEVVAIDSVGRSDVALLGASPTVVMARRMDTAASGRSIRNSRCTRCLCIPTDSIRCRPTAAGIVDTMDIIIIIAIDDLNLQTTLDGFRAGNPEM